MEPAMLTWSSLVAPRRTAQHFDRFEVERVDNYAVGRAHEDAVNENTDRRIDGRNRAVDTLAANREVLHARKRADRLKLHIRHGVAQVLDLLDEHRVELRSDCRGTQQGAQAFDF